MQEIAVILVATVPSLRHNVQVCGLVTSSYALQILLTVSPCALHDGVLQQWWIFLVQTSIRNGQPVIDPCVVQSRDVTGRAWDDVVSRVLSSRLESRSIDLQTIRAIKCMSNDYDRDAMFLRAAICLVYD